MKPLRAGALALTSALLVGGCSYSGVESIPLPFREGTSDDAVVVKVEMAQASGLTQNGEVKVDDVTVGSIREIDVDGWNAVLTIGIDPSVELPENARATVGQKSLLGAKYLELSRPAEGAGRLSSGDTIALASTGQYPETEQVLASLAVVLNGGGLQQVKTITDELDQAVSGREPEVERFLENFDVFISSLDAQSDDIVAVIERLDTLSGTLAQDEVLETALDTLPDALDELAKDREQLTRTLTAVADLGETADQVVDESGDATVANLRQLRPALKALADSGQDLTESLSIALTMPFPSNTSFPKMFQGDYGNLFLTVDVSPELLAKNLLTGFTPRISGSSQSLLEGPPLGASDGSPVPEIAGLPDLPLVGDLLGGGASSSSTGGLEQLLPGLTSLLGGTKGQS